METTTTTTSEEIIISKQKIVFFKGRLLADPFNFSKGVGVTSSSSSTFVNKQYPLDSGLIINHN